MGLFKSPAEKAEANFKSSQNKKRQQAAKDEMDIAEGSFNEDIKKAREDERKAEQEYSDALSTGNEEKIKGALDSWKAAEKATETAKQAKSDGLKKMRQSYNDIGKEGKSTGNQNTDESPKEMTDDTGSQDTGSQDTGSQDTDSQDTDSQDTGSQDTGSQDTGSQDTGNTNSQDTIRAGSGKFRLSDSFYRDISAAVKGQPTGNTLGSAAATAKEQGQNQQNEAANRQMEAQQSQQIANRNEFSEAGKIASMQNDAENRQNINNLSAAAGNAAALQRKTNAPDVQSQQNRQDTQRNIAAQRREEGDKAQQGATESFGQAEQFKIKSRDHDKDMDTSERLSMGEGAEPELVEEQTPEEPKPEEPKPEEPKPEEPKPEEPAEPPEDKMPAGNAQHVINWLLGSSKGQDIQPQEGADGDNGLAAWVQKKYGVQPVSKWKYDSQDPSAKSWEQLWLNDSEVPGDKQGAIDALRQGRVGEGKDKSRNFSQSEMGEMAQTMNAYAKGTDCAAPGYALVGEEGPELVKMNGGEEVIPSGTLKRMQQELSDCRIKHIREDYNNGYGITPDDFAWLARHLGGKFSHDDKEYDFFNDDDWADDSDGSVLKGYADHIRNYLYTYKPEAVGIDNSIDPDEEHIGPMAQDIEQVNPACIKETSEGIKTVDTARLAMMNAGAIGDLARQMQDLTDKLKELGL